MTDQEIETLANEALNAACLVIQTKLGVTDGGLAGIVFSDDLVLILFAEYIRSELQAREL